MEISRSGVEPVAVQRWKNAQQNAGGSFEQQLQAAQGAAEVPDTRVADATAPDPATHPSKGSDILAYQASVVDDPTIGTTAKYAPYDPSLEGAMRRFMAASGITGMTPEQYYNYMGSPQEKYDQLKAVAGSPVAGYEQQKRVFGADPAEESRVEFMRELIVAGKAPATPAEFDALWQADAARQHAIAREETAIRDGGGSFHPDYTRRT